MKATSLKFKLIDTYLEMLKGLSREHRLELIARLSESVKRPKRDEKKSLNKLFGAFKSKKSADEIIASLKSARQFNRKPESF